MSNRKLFVGRNLGGEAFAAPPPHLRLSVEVLCRVNTFVNVFKQDQQDATLHIGIYYYKC